MSLGERISDLKKLDQAETRVRNSINRYQEGRQAFIDQSARLFAPVTQKQEAATQELKESVQQVQTAVQDAAAPEVKLIRDWLSKVNDPVFGLQSDGEGGYVLGLSRLLPLYTNITPNDYQILLDQDGIHLKGTSVRYPLSKENLHALTRNAKPVNKAAKDTFLRLVDLTLGVDFIALSGLPDLNQRMMNLLQESVKYRDLVSRRYLADHDVSWSTGSGCLSPDSPHPLQRLAVLLGAAKAGNMQSNLQEFTGILDVLLRDGQLNKDTYKEMTRRFLSKRHGRID